MPACWLRIRLDFTNSTGDERLIRCRLILDSCNYDATGREKDCLHNLLTGFFKSNTERSGLLTALDGVKHV